MTTTDTHAANLMRMGLAGPGTLAVQRSTGQLFKITKVMNVNYGILDEDGREWKIKFGGLEPAPAGAIWGGPEKGRTTIAKEERAARLKAAAAEFKAGDVVEMAKDKDRERFPGSFVIVKQTTSGRFKLVGVGTGLSLTAPATLIRRFGA